MGIALSGGHRKHSNLHWAIKGTIFALSGLLGGAIAGAAVGAFGAFVATAATGIAAVLAFFAAVAVVVAGTGNLMGRKRKPPQFDIETSQRWLHLGAVIWAILNGGALGSAFMTRIAFWTWFLIPIAAFASQSLVYGALIWGLYGFVRCGLAMVILATPNVMKMDDRDFYLRLTDGREVAGRVDLIGATFMAAVIVIATM